MLSENIVEECLKYMNASAEIYGIIPLKKLAEIINEQNEYKVTDADLKAIYRTADNDELHFAIYKQNVVQEAILMFDGDFERLRFYQKSKPYKKYEKTEFLKSAGYYIELPDVYQKLRKYLVAEIEVYRDVAVGICEDIYIIIHTSIEIPKLADILNVLERRSLQISYEQYENMMKIITECFNNTPMWANNGYTPNELHNYYQEHLKNIRQNSKAAGNNTSLVISVAYQSGCYRHIRISESATLFDLHSAIIDAFGFIDDHAHAFFMNNIAWDERAGYYANFIKGKRHTNNYSLQDLNLEIGDKFKYIFDFGEEWCFQCKVLKKLEEDTEKAQVVRSKGEMPPQYEYDEDFEDDEDSEDDEDE